MTILNLITTAETQMLSILVDLNVFKHIHLGLKENDPEFVTNLICVCISMFEMAEEGNNLDEIIGKFVDAGCLDETKRLVTHRNYHVHNESDNFIKRFFDHTEAQYYTDIPHNGFVFS